MAEGAKELIDGLNEDLAATGVSGDARAQVERLAGLAREAGLDPFRTVFELVDHKEMSEIASYGGFPTRDPHWLFGMDYDQLMAEITVGGLRRMREKERNKRQSDSSDSIIDVDSKSNEQKAQVARKRRAKRQSARAQGEVRKPARLSTSTN